MTSGPGLTPELDFQIRFYERILKERPHYVDALMPLAEAYTRKGLHEKGLEADLQLVKLCGKDPIVHYNCACSYALTGKKSEAIKMLKRAIRLGYLDFHHLRQDPDLESLRGDPQFEKLVDYFLKH